LREEVTSRFFDWVATTRRRALARERVTWLARREQSLAASLKAGRTNQSEWLQAHVDVALAENDLADLAAKEAVLRSELNALLGRSPDAPLVARSPWSRSAPPVGRWDSLREELGARNAEVAGLQAEVAVRQRALELARLQFLPDVNPLLAFTGGASQTIGAALVLPLTWRRLQAQVANLDALLRASRAMLEQEQTTKTSELATALVLVENLDRQRRLWEEQLLPNFRLVCASLRRAYEANTVPFADWARAEAARTEVEARLEEIIALREQQVARVDRLLGRFERFGTAERAEVAHGD
jgi:outer membrane protein TolC